jgi:hypothetical protein
MTEVVVIIGRADFMFRHGSEYEAHRLRNGDLVYFKKELYGLTRESRIDVGCNYNLVDVQAAADDTCSYWFLDLNANLLSQGWVKFSLGIGLMITIILRLFAFAVKIAFDKSLSDESKNSAGGVIGEEIWGWLVMTIVELCLHFQQFIVLLPFEVILPNDYCLHVQVPVSVLKAICRYKIACTGIPIGLPMFVGCGAVSFLLASCAESMSEGNGKYCAMFFGLMALSCAIWSFFGLTMIIFWLFGGIVLGFWYVFGGLSLGYLTSEINFILVLVSSSTVLILFLEKLFIGCCCQGRGDYGTVREGTRTALELTGVAAIPSP